MPATPPLSATTPSLVALVQRHQALIAQQRNAFTLRMHRALSWLQRAEAAGTDDDVAFVCLWIAFNAAYACEIDPAIRLCEQTTFRNFLEKLCLLDEQKAIDKLVWQEFSGSIRVLLDTPYVLQGFWDYHSQRITELEWKNQLAAGKKMASQALSSGNTPMLLGVVFNRLYTLRNQLIHGGATWNSKVNRKQLHDCVSLLHKLIPQIISLMMEHPDTLWGDACYPVVEMVG